MLSELGRGICKHTKNCNKRNGKYMGIPNRVTKLMNTMTKLKNALEDFNN